MNVWFPLPSNCDASDMSPFVCCVKSEKNLEVSDFIYLPPIVAQEGEWVTCQSEGVSISTYLWARC